MSYDRSDATGLDYAVNRFYSSQQGRFAQVDPIGMAAVSLGNPQSLNLYSYVQNDPVNFVDPSGLMMSFCGAEYSFSECGGGGGFWGGDFGGHVAEYNREYGGMPGRIVEGLRRHNERVDNAIAGNGYRTIEEILSEDFDIHYWPNPDGSIGTHFDLTVTVNGGSGWGGPQVRREDILRWKEDINDKIRFARDARDAYRRFGRRANSVEFLNRIVRAFLEEKYGEIRVAGLTDSQGHITIIDDTPQTRAHEEAHRRDLLEGQRRFGVDTPAYNKWYNNPRNYAAREVRAYAAGILNLQKQLRDLNYMEKNLKLR